MPRRLPPLSSVQVVVLCTAAAALLAAALLIPRRNLGELTEGDEGPERKGGDDTGQRQRGHEQLKKKKKKKGRKKKKKRSSRGEVDAASEGEAIVAFVDAAVLPTRECCPSCNLPMPVDLGTSTHMACCGRILCNGCVIKQKMDGDANDNEAIITTCAHCGEPSALNDKEALKRLRRRVREGDAGGMFLLAAYYEVGGGGVRQSDAKAVDLYHRAAVKGFAPAAHNLYTRYNSKHDLFRHDAQEARRWLNRAVEGGSVPALHDMGLSEGTNGNLERAVRCLRVAAAAGYEKSIAALKTVYADGLLGKEELGESIRQYETARAGMRSDARDSAANMSNEVLSLMSKATRQ